MKLYSYFRSSAAYRVRIALNFKGIAYETVPVHLIKDGGHNRRPEFRAVNPQMRVPALVAPTGDVLIQSLAIIEYLDETQPDAAAAAEGPDRASQGARAGADRRLRYPSAQQCRAASLPQAPNASGAERDRCLVPSLGHRRLRGVSKRWRSPGPIPAAAEVTIADICLVPQVYNARRLKVPLDKFPKIVGIDAACLKLPAFDRARPENQPDAE